MIVPLLLFSGTMVATFLYKNNTTVGNELNKVLSDRLSLNTKAFENYEPPCGRDEMGKKESKLAFYAETYVVGGQ